MVALELLEYKIGDLVAGYEPTGGAQSVAPLHSHLTQFQGELSAEARERFATASQELARLGVIEAALEATSDEADDVTFDLSFDQLELGTSIAEEAAKQVLASEADILLSPAEREEQRVLKRLAQRVWWAGVERTLGRLAATYRAERERYTVRLLYGALRNLARYAQTKTFAHDPTLVHFEVQEAVLERSDPLYSFNDVGSVTELLREFAETALSFKAPKSPYRKLELDEAQTLAYLRRFTLAVARNPYAGRLSSLPSHDVDAQQLRQMIQALSREPLSDAERSAQRSALEARLQAAWERERSQRSMFERDTEAFARSAEMFFAQLEQLLPKRIGGAAPEPRLPGGVLFAENSALNLTAIPRSATALTLRLKGPMRFSLAGVDVAIIGSPQAWTLVLEGEERSFADAVQLREKGKRVAAFLEEDYLYLDVRDDVRSLSALIAEALAVHTTLRLGFLDLLKTAVGSQAGEPQETAKRALTRLGRLVAQAPDKRRALEGLCASAAKASGTPFTGSAREIFLQHLHLAVTSPNDDLIESLKGTRRQLLDEPLNLRVAGQPLSVRRYHDRPSGAPESAVVMMPGAPLGALSDYALFEVPGGTLLCALAAGEFAAVHLQDEAAQTLHF